MSCTEDCALCLLPVFFVTSRSAQSLVPQFAEPCGHTSRVSVLSGRSCRHDRAEEGRESPDPTTDERRVRRQARLSSRQAFACLTMDTRQPADAGKGSSTRHGHKPGERADEHLDYCGHLTEDGWRCPRVDPRRPCA